jgi:hypothetical protein
LSAQRRAPWPPDAPARDLGYSPPGLVPLVLLTAFSAAVLLLFYPVAFAVMLVLAAAGALRDARHPGLVPVYAPAEWRKAG